MLANKSLSGKKKVSLLWLTTIHTLLIKQLTILPFDKKRNIHISIRQKNFVFINAAFKRTLLLLYAETGKPQNQLGWKNLQDH